MAPSHAWIFLFLSAIALSSQAGNPAATFSPPEVTSGTVRCSAAWNEFCDDRKTIQVPDGYKLCKHTITEKEKSGDSHYEITAVDATGITVAFSAKGNRNRLKPEGAVVDLAISLQGVRNDDDCSGNTVITSTASNIDKPAPEPTANVAHPVAPKPEQKPVVAPPLASTSGPKTDACACSEWMRADKVTSCLIHGHGRDKISCDSLPAVIQCVDSRETCHEIQKDNCPQVLGIDQTLSRKRIFVPDSPYCEDQKTK